MTTSLDDDLRERLRQLIQHHSRDLSVDEQVTAVLRLVGHQDDLTWQRAIFEKPTPVVRRRATPRDTTFIELVHVFTRIEHRRLVAEANEKRGES